MGPTRCAPVAFGFKGSERGSKFGIVASDGEHITSGRQSFRMQPRNLRPGIYRPGRHIRGLLGVPRCFEL